MRYKALNKHHLSFRVAKKEFHCLEESGINNEPNEVSVNALDSATAVPYAIEEEYLEIPQQD